MLAKINSSTLFGIDAFQVSVEVSVTKGLGYIITGLPDDGIKESLSRIAIAIHSNEFQMPRTKLVINLAPADVRKTGTAFDLPITLGILMATGQIPVTDKLLDYLVIGEI
ncbi:MAG TPA: magnesium chelatase domain-containing protein, partial [Puia sp.]|nr:magnesium chelatase domain-containing protein [Puia sp.]